MNESYQKPQKINFKTIDEGIDIIMEWGIMVMSRTYVNREGEITTTSLIPKRIHNIAMSDIAEFTTEVETSKEEKEEWQTMYM